MANYTPPRPDLAAPSRLHVGGQEREIEIRPGVPMRFCWCPPGQFLMGSPDSEPGRDSDEGPPHPVRLTQGFWLAKHPVSQRQWQAVMGNNPSQKGRGDAFPVDSVSWEDCASFCGQSGLYLPAEAQWEYACRAGGQSPVAVGGGDYLNSQMANFEGDNPYGGGANGFEWIARGTTLAEGCFPPNAWGLHDMHGQLWEWCHDWKSEYKTGTPDDPYGPAAGEGRVLRGGGWILNGRNARSAIRVGNWPGVRRDLRGLRPSSTRPGPEAAALRSKAKGGAKRGTSGA